LAARRLFARRLRFVYLPAGRTMMRPNPATASQVPPSPVPPSQAAAGANVLSPRRLIIWGDYIRQQIGTGRSPSAILLIVSEARQSSLSISNLSAFGTPIPGIHDADNEFFQIYSMSKAVTRSRMMLVDDASWPSDDPVSKYIHAFANAKSASIFPMRHGSTSAHARAVEAPITIRALAAAYPRTAGITYESFFARPVSNTLGQSTLSAAIR